MKHSKWYVFGYVNGRNSPIAVSMAYKTKKLAKRALNAKMFIECDKPFIAMAWEG